jgi:O-antigen/teichoic acid export membrane protein
MDHVKSRMAKGAVWMVAFTFLQRGIGLLSTVILARLLLPEDFGLLALAMTLVSFLEMASAFGFDAAIIQRPDVDRRHLDTAWTFTVAFGCLSAALMAVLAQPTAAFYREPKLEAIIYVIAVGWLIRNFQNIGVVAFQKELEFNKEFWFMASQRFVSFAVTIPLAIWLRNYWALVIGLMSGHVTAVAISFLASSYRPRFSLAATRELFSFSSWMLVNNVLAFLYLKTSHLIIGRFAGASALGLYNLSYELSNMPTNELMAPINRAVFPGYAKLAGDLDALRRSYLEVLSSIALFVLPAGLGLAAVADPMVRVALGSRWLEAIPLIELLGIYGALLSLGTNLAAAYLALGRPQLLSIDHGPIGAAWAVLGVQIVFLPFTFTVGVRVLKLKVCSLLGSLWRPVLASAVMFSCVRLVLSLVPQEDIFGSSIALLLGVSVGASVYGLLVLLLWRLSGSPSGGEAMAVAWLTSRTPFRRLGLS